VKRLTPIEFDVSRCRAELADFRSLLDSKADLGERSDIKPFFESRLQLTALIGSYDAGLGRASELAFEFPLMGDFATDLILGGRSRLRYVVIEFEDGTRDGVFRTAGKKSTPEWTPRFEHGFSQIIDWFTMIDDVKNTQDFREDFGHGHVHFTGMLIAGRNSGLTESMIRRLRWRNEKVRVDSHTIECVTYDQLYDDLARRIDF
jgi:hypothetical protein